MHPWLCRQLLSLGAVAALVAPTLVMAESPRPAPLRAGQHPREFSGVATQAVSLQYLLFLPADPAVDTQKRWPLLVFLHGAGERGTEIAKVAVHGPPKIAPERKDFPFIVASPQCPEGEVWSIPQLNRWLDHLLETLPVDPRRVYLTGLSMGGYGSWEWSMQHPQRFAAVAPICGGGNAVLLRISGGPRREALARLPIWAFHGARDEVVPLAESERMIAAFQAVGAKPRLTVYPEAGHDAWTDSYQNPALYEWFLQHSR